MVNLYRNFIWLFEYKKKYFFYPKISFCHRWEFSISDIRIIFLVMMATDWINSIFYFFHIRFIVAIASIFLIFILNIFLVYNILIFKFILSTFIWSNSIYLFFCLIFFDWICLIWFYWFCLIFFVLFVESELLTTMISKSYYFPLREFDIY